MDIVTRGVGPVHLGLDVSKNKIAVGVLRWGEQVPDTEMISHDEASVRRLIDRFADRGRLRSCYEAGPTGFGLYRLLVSMGVACDVVAPSLVPKAPGDGVKTDRRDCRRLARLHRAGELVAVDVDGDGFVFDLARPSRLRDDAYGRPAWRFPVACRLAGRRFADLKLDVVARPEETGGVGECITDDPAYARDVGDAATRVRGCRSIVTG